jgi:acyl-coenzyme A thioesterase 9
MDIFAVALVFKHVLNPKQEDSQQSPFSIVTALVDRIDIKRKILVESDIKISGHVTWVGRSSAESTLELHQHIDGKWEKVTEAVFVLVARDPTNKGSAFINPLQVVGEEELVIYNKGIENQNRRQTMKNISLFSHPPSEDEKTLIHDFFIKTVDHKAMSFKARILPENSMWMEDAKLKNLLICQPENRNRFNKIFGGFIMRQAFELAWANAYVYGKARPFCMYMDDIWFRAPVEIGSLLYFNSQVCYTQDQFMQVRVSAEILSPETGSMSVTNVFQYTFKMKEKTPPQVIPKTYHEAMMWLQGRRHFQNCVSSNTKYSQ